MSKIYLNHKTPGLPMETLDEYPRTRDGRKEAQKDLREYRSIPNQEGRYWLSSRSTKEWRDDPRTTTGLFKLEDYAARHRLKVHQSESGQQSVITSRQDIVRGLYNLHDVRVICNRHGEIKFAPRSKEQILEKGRKPYMNINSL